MMMPERKLLTYPEVTAMLRCCEKTVYNRVKAEEIHPFTMDGWCCSLKIVLKSS